MHGKCGLNEIIRNVSCTLKGWMCAKNMKFVLIKRTTFRHYYIFFASCILQCKCIKGYKEENGECIKKNKKMNKMKNIVSLNKYFLYY